MTEYPVPLRALLASLRKLPGIGSRNAERMALRLLDTKGSWPEDLARDILEARRSVGYCPQCGFFTEGDSLCQICLDPGRDGTILCVVEAPVDVLPIERAGGYQGLYHCLGGKLSPLDGVGPEQLSIASLLTRSERVKEIILALGTDIEGETTALFLADQLKSITAQITRPAQGMPMGSGLDITDPLTLHRALQQRRPMA